MGRAEAMERVYDWLENGVRDDPPAIEIRVVLNALRAALALPPEEGARDEWKRLTELLWASDQSRAWMRKVLDMAPEEGARDRALEEAARIAEEPADWLPATYQSRLARAIRALKSAPPSTERTP